MRILQVTTTSRRRGAEVFASELARSLVGRGHTVSTAALETPAAHGPLDFDAVGNPRRRPASIRRLAELTSEADVALAHGGSTLQPVALAASLARRPFVYRNIGDPSFWGTARGASLRIGLPLRRAAAVLALYEGARDYMVRRYRLDPDRVTVAPNAVDPAGFPERTAESRERERERLGIHNNRVVLGYLGSLSSEKRPQWALDAAAAIPDSVLLVVGDGPLRSDLERGASRLGDRDGVPACRLVGAVERPDSFLAALDVLLLPSATEGIPGVLLEAALVGVPTVATDVGGVGEVVAAVGGVTAPVDGKQEFIELVKQVGTDPAAHAADRQAVLSRYGIEAVTDTYEEVLLHVGAEPPTPRG